MDGDDKIKMYLQKSDNDSSFGVLILRKDCRNIIGL